MIKIIRLENEFKLSIMALIVILGFMLFTSNVSAQTGSHAGATTSPLTSFWFETPDEIKKIRELLNDGKSQEAVEASNNFLKMLRSSWEDDNIRLYFGYNALCASHTSNKSPQDAVEACSKAISIFPDKWQAYNNRGTAYYTTGDFRKALGNYKQALVFGSEVENIKTLIQHNIDLVASQNP